MTEEQAEYKTETQDEEANQSLKGILARAKKVMLKNALVKVKEGKSLTAKEAEMIEEAEAEARSGEASRGMVSEFRNLLEVSEWLDAQGWKVSRSTLYKHAKDGRIRPGEDGTFTAKAVERYAIQWLHKKSDAEKVSAEKLAEKKEKAEIRYKEAMARTAEMKFAILEGRYVPQDQLYLELAARAAVLDTGIRALVHLRADTWLAVCNGDHGKISDLIRTILVDVEDLVNSFSTTKEFQVMFKEEPAGAEAHREESEKDGAAE